MIVEREGDILQSGADVICHQVNCMGVMGGGLARQIRDKYPDVYQQYQSKCDADNYCLGDVQYCGEAEVIIANMFAQFGYGRDKQYTDYDALKRCLKNVRGALQIYSHHHSNYRVAFPHGLGCGLAGGDWAIVHGMIDEIFGDSECICEI